MCKFADSNLIRIKMINIGIIGIGGVGGYLAAKLAVHFEESESVSIHLFARGEAARVMKRDGIKLVSTKEGREDVGRPRAVYSSGENAPVMDYLFVCVKSYSVGSIIDDILRSTNENSVIIPFLNGVDGREELICKLPNRMVLDACVYIISKILSPGVIEISETSDRTKYFFGGYAVEEKKRAMELEQILKPAIDNLIYRDNIDQIVWGKFVRISTASTLQSYRNATNGDIKSNSEIRKELEGLIAEFMSVAEGLGHILPEDTLERNLGHVNAIGDSMTTSMQRDFQEHKSTELETITGYIVRAGEQLGIPTPLYKMMYDNLLLRSSSPPTTEDQL